MNAAQEVLRGESKMVQQKGGVVMDMVQEDVKTKVAATRVVDLEYVSHLRVCGKGLPTWVNTTATSLMHCTTAGWSWRSQSTQGHVTQSCRQLALSIYVYTPIIKSIRSARPRRLRHASRNRPCGGRPCP